MARVLALTRDLLFGSRVQGALVAAGHEVELVADPANVPERLDATALLILDLTDDGLDGPALVRSLIADGRLGATRTLGFYSHVDAGARERAEAAGVELVVPRSRMAREGVALAERLLA